MTEINDRVEKWHEKRKNNFLAFSTAAFFFVLPAGHVVGAFMFLDTIGRTIAVPGTMCELGLDVYSIVEYKDNSSLAVLGIVMSSLAVMVTVHVGKTITLRLDISQNLFKKIGPGTLIP